MKVIYLSNETDLSQLNMNLVQSKSQNKYGTMHVFREKLDLVTSVACSDYHVFTSSENGKTFLCLKSPQLNAALKAITDNLTAECGYEFKPEKDACYVRVNPEHEIPRNQQINVSVKVYGVFYQASTKISFLQTELTGFQSYPLVEFNKV
jgi:hypothetical protein